MAESIDQTKHRAAKRPFEEEFNAKPWRNWERQSAFNSFITIDIPSEGYYDLTDFLKSTKNDVHGIIVEELGVHKALKFYLTVNVQLTRSDPDGFVATSTPFLCSLPSIVLESSDIHEQIDEASDRIIELLENFQSEGSGFVFDCILKCQLNIAAIDIIGGSSYSTPKLPKYIQSKKATVNIENKENKNFLYCLSYVRKPAVKDAQRPSKYVKDLNNLNISGINFPITVNQIAKFEQQNVDFSVNVYKLDKKIERQKEVNLIPLYTTPERNRKYHADLLQIGNTREPHYVVINDMSRLLSKQTAD